MPRVLVLVEALHNVMDLITSFLLTVLNFFVPMKHGHVDVVGSGFISIKLGGYQNVRWIRFVDDGCYTIPPCGGGVGDTLEWELNETASGGHVLDVKWSVNRPRRFAWLASWR